MHISEIEERLKKLIVAASSQEIRIDDVRPDVALVKNGLALDSIAVLQLLVAIEEEFTLILDDDTLTVAAFESIGTLARYVEAQLPTRTPSALR